MSSTPDRSEISRVLSHTLRHAPGEHGLVLDPEGWAPVSDVLGALHRLGPGWESVAEAVLDEVLEAAEEKRHQMSKREDPGGAWPLRTGPAGGGTG